MHEREVAVDGVEEVGALRGLAADRHVAGSVRRGPDAVERRPARGGVAVLGRDDGDERGAVAAPVGGRDGAADALDAARAPSRRRRDRPSGRARRTARAARCRCRSPRAARGRRVPARPGPASRRAGCRAGSRRRRRRARPGRRSSRRPRPSGGARRGGPRPTSRGWRGASRRLRGQSSLGPIVARTTGSRVMATATLTSGISRPGDADAAQERAPAGRRSASSEIATVVPLKTTAEPACCIAFAHRRLVGRRPAAGAPRASGRRRAARSRSRCRARSARRGTGRSPRRR